MALFSWQKAKKDDGTEELQFSKEDQERMDKAAKAAEELPAIKEKLSSLDKVSEFITMFQKERDDEKRQKAAAATTAAQTQSDEEFETLMLTDPKSAVAKAIQPTQQAILTLRADNLRREVFEDEKRFKYYHGDLKREIDQLISGQSLALRNDPSMIENAYSTVVGRHHDEIMEGKLKDRFAGSDGGNRGTSSGDAGDTGSKGTKTTLVIDDDVKKLAKMFNTTPEEYVKLLDKEGVGYA